MLSSRQSSASADRIWLAVVRYPDGWRILSKDGRWGRYRYAVDAEEGALRLAARIRATGTEVDILVQGLYGEVERLDREACA